MSLTPTQPLLCFACQSRASLPGQRPAELREGSGCSPGSPSHVGGARTRFCWHRRGAPALPKHPLLLMGKPAAAAGLRGARRAVCPWGALPAWEGPGNGQGMVPALSGGHPGPARAGWSAGGWFGTSPGLSPTSECSFTAEKRSKPPQHLNALAISP